MLKIPETCSTFKTHATSSSLSIYVFPDITLFENSPLFQSIYASGARIVSSSFLIACAKSITTSNAYDCWLSELLAEASICSLHLSRGSGIRNRQFRHTVCFQLFLITHYIFLHNFDVKLSNNRHQYGKDLFTLFVCATLLSALPASPKGLPSSSGPMPFIGWAAQYVRSSSLHKLLISSLFPSQSSSIPRDKSPTRQSQMATILQSKDRFHLPQPLPPLPKQRAGPRRSTRATWTRDRVRSVLSHTSWRVSLTATSTAPLSLSTFPLYVPRGLTTRGATSRLRRAIAITSTSLPQIHHTWCR